MKVEVAVLGSRPYQAYGFCGRKATLQPQQADSRGECLRKIVVYQNMLLFTDRVIDG